MSKQTTKSPLAANVHDPDDVLSVGLAALTKVTTPEYIALNYVRNNTCHRENMNAFLAIYRNQIEFIRAYCPRKTILATNDDLLEALIIYHLKVYYRTAIAANTNWRTVAQMIIKGLHKK